MVLIGILARVDVARRAQVSRDLTRLSGVSLWPRRQESGTPSSDRKTLGL